MLVTNGLDQQFFTKGVEFSYYSGQTLFYNNQFESLRSLIDSDLDFLEKIENNTSLWEFGSEQKKYTREELRSYIKNSDTPLQIAKQSRFVVDYKSIPVGFIDLFNYKEKEVSVGIIIDEEYQNRGFAQESLSILSHHCFDNLNIKKLN